MLDVFKIAKQVERDDDRVGFEVEPREMYPEAIAHVVEATGGPRPGGVLGTYWDRAKQLPPAAWELALRTRDECDAEQLAARAEALEIARLWFTEMLHAAINHKPMGLHILKDELWRL